MQPVLGSYAPSAPLPIASPPRPLDPSTAARLRARAASVPTASSSFLWGGTPEDDEDEDDNYHETIPEEVEDPLDGDALPAYSPRLQPTALPALVTKKHTFATKGQKLKIEIEAPGEATVLLVEGSGEDGKTWLCGGTGFCFFLGGGGNGGS